MPALPIQQAFSLAVQHHEAGRLAEAEALYRQILAVAPNHPEALHLLGVIGHQVGKDDLAAELILRAIALLPTVPLFHSNLGQVYARLGRHNEAMAAYRRALQLDPDYADAHYNMGVVLTDQGQFDEAIAAYRRALQLQPDYASASNNLGGALSGQGRFEEAIAAFRHVLQLQPDSFLAYNNLGVAFTGRGQFDEAIAAFRQALALRPHYPDAYNNLGNALKDRGQLDDAIAAYRRALELSPARAEAHSNLIHALQFRPGLEREIIVEEQRRWNRQFSDPLKSSFLAHTNDRDPERRLRVGYVSPDFRDHAVAFFLAPLLEAHDHRQFEIYGYSSVSLPDAVTARMRQCADVWREVRYLSDAQLAESIRQDGIDILVDLALHTAGTRLPAFARKPAPVQVSWLGYAGSTGVEAIGYRLSDAQIDPVGTEKAGSGEQVVRLPDAWCCYAPIAEFPAVSALPAATGGTMTFGSLNQFAKINEPLLACWAGLLRALPDARLLMVCPAGQAQERTSNFLAVRGVAPKRVEWVAPGSWADYIRFFERIDVGLDSYPCNGMTTTCHALWMGVPMVTWVGESAVSRAGASLLQTIGLPKLVARSEEEYARIAVELAGDLKQLAELRATLRPRMAASPLMDAQRFARNVEAAYRAIWRQWCREEPPE